MLARAGLDRRLLVRAPRNPRARAIAPPGAPHTGQAPGRPAPCTSHRREDPRPVVPQADRVLAQPPPDRDRRDRRTIPRLTASIASSALDQRDSGTPRSAGNSHAGALTSATCAGGKRRRRPGRGLSSSPCNPSRQKRLRHVETAWRDCPNPPAISELYNPSAANKIAFARTTSRYGPAYAAARRSSSRRCSSLKTTRCGDLCAINTNTRRQRYDSFRLAAHLGRRPPSQAKRARAPRFWGKVRMAPEIGSA